MGIKRTREDKQLAQMRRVEHLENSGSISLRVGDVVQKVSRDLVLPVEIIKKDVIKTISVTLVIIAIQFFIAELINRGVITLPAF